MSSLKYLIRELFVIHTLGTLYAYRYIIGMYFLNILIYSMKKKIYIENIIN